MIAVLFPAPMIASIVNAMVSAVRCLFIVYCRIQFVFITHKSRDNHVYDFVAYAIFV